MSACRTVRRPMTRDGTLVARYMHISLLTCKNGSLVFTYLSADFCHHVAVLNITPSQNNLIDEVFYSLSLLSENFKQMQMKFSFEFIPFKLNVKHLKQD